MSHSVIFEGVKEIPEKLVKDVHEAYGFLETFLQDYTYVAGDDLSIADFSIINTISNANILVPMDEEEYPNISSWKKKNANFAFL
ncbi:hypothetical protein NQ314_017312 [Rhamnusium bicolor]|uniref:GST C-terminal domain-containing protein n=1 Tax=Rhamnusium bicolor TaxID=1586634 RepID=A0AAV8WUN9_9CUCU|nr:hypothetical protein NQ314_017312 [Rhamnusium bicolor]